MPNCLNCGKLICNTLVLQCENCLAVNFCSIDCKNDMANEKSFYSHANDCNYFKTLMKDNEELIRFPFKFILGSNKYSYKKFMKIKGIYNCGFWKFKCPVTQDIVEIDAQLRAIETGDYSGYILVDEASILSIPVLKEMESICNWNEYYKWRGLSSESPIAGLLHWTLTTFHILFNILSFSEKTIFDEKFSHINKSISIHFIGVEVELNVLPTFFELLNFFRDYSLKLSFIGDKIPVDLDKKHYEHKNVKILISRGLYHDCNLDKDFSNPDVVIGFNAGLSIFETWKQTVEKLSSLKVPVFFTDYCRYSADLSVSALRNSGIVNSSSEILISINPFRSPFREKGNGVNFALYSNAVLFQLPD